MFLWNLALWAAVAATASKFELIRTISYSNASEQVKRRWGHPAMTTRAAVSVALG